MRLLSTLLTFPPTHRSPRNKLRYNNHSDPCTLDPQKVEENTAAQIVLDLFEGLVWMDGEGRAARSG